MPSNESVYPTDWLRIAEKDLARVERLIDVNDIGLAAFCLQQSVEKFLKAFLLSKGWKLRKIHDLNVLIDDAVIYDPSIEIYRESCQKITAFYFLERYPLVTEFGVTEDDVRSSLEQVKNLIEKIRTKVGKL
jgi:HEPN domain-containing protein